MKRCGYWLLSIGLVLCGEGCKRSSSGKKDALLVSRESDAIYAPAIEKTIGKMAEKTEFQMDFTKVKFDVIGTERYANYPPDALKPKVTIKWPSPPERKQGGPPVPPTPDELAQVRIIKDTQKRDTVALGKAFWDFLKNPTALDAGPPDDNAQSLDRLYSYLRRNQQIEAYEKLTGKKMEVTFLHFFETPPHIMAWHDKGQNEDGDRAVFLTANKFVWFPEAELENSLQNQELLVGWRYAAQFSLAHYTTLPPTAFKDRLKTESPARILAAIKQAQPLAIKNPPEKRGLDALLKQLKENVSAGVAKTFETKHIRVNFDANLYDDNDWLVCLGKSQNKLGANGKEVQGQNGQSVKQHRTLHCDGKTIVAYDAVLIDQKFK